MYLLVERGEEDSGLVKAHFEGYNDTPFVFCSLSYDYKDERKWRLIDRLYYILLFK